MADQDNSEFSYLLRDLMISLQDNLLTQTIDNDLKHTNDYVTWFGHGTVTKLLSANTIQVKLDYIDNRPDSLQNEIAVELLYSAAPEVAVGQLDGGSVPFLAANAAQQQLGILLEKDNKKVSIIFIGQRDSESTNELPRYGGFVFTGKEDWVNADMIATGFSFFSEKTVKSNYNRPFVGTSDKSRLFKKDISLNLEYVKRYFKSLQSDAARKFLGLHRYIDISTKTFVSNRMIDAKLPGFDKERPQQSIRLLTWNLHNTTNRVLVPLLEKIYSINPNIAMFPECSIAANHPMISEEIEKLFDKHQTIPLPTENHVNYEVVERPIFEQTNNRKYLAHSCLIETLRGHNLLSSKKIKITSFPTDIAGNEVYVTDSSYIADYINNIVMLDSTKHNYLKQMVLSAKAENAREQENDVVSFADIARTYARSIRAKKKLETSNPNIVETLLIDHIERAEYYAWYLAHSDLIPIDITTLASNLTITNDFSFMKINNYLDFSFTCTEPSIYESSTGHLSDTIGLLSNLRPSKIETHAPRPYSLSEAMYETKSGTPQITNAKFKETTNILKTFQEGVPTNYAGFFGAGLVDPHNPGFTAVVTGVPASNQTNVFQTRPFMYARYTIKLQTSTMPVQIFTMNPHATVLRDNLKELETTLYPKMESLKFFSCPSTKTPEIKDMKIKILALKDNLLPKLEQDYFLSNFKVNSAPFLVTNVPTVLQQIKSRVSALIDSCNNLDQSVTIADIENIKKQYYLLDKEIKDIDSTYNVAIYEYVEKFVKLSDILLQINIVLKNSFINTTQQQIIKIADEAKSCLLDLINKGKEINDKTTIKDVSAIKKQLDTFLLTIKKLHSYGDAAVIDLFLKTYLKQDDLYLQIQNVINNSFSEVQQAHIEDRHLHVVGIHLPSNVVNLNDPTAQEGKNGARRALSHAVIRYLKEIENVDLANDFVIIIGDANLLQEETNDPIGTDSSLYWLCNYSDIEERQLVPYSNNLIKSGTFIQNSYNQTINANIAKFDHVIVSKSVLNRLSNNNSDNPLNLKIWFDSGISTDHVGLSIDIKGFI